MKRALTVIALIFYVTAAQSQSLLLDSLQKVVAKHQKDTIEVLALDAISGEYFRKDMEKTKHYAHLTLSLAKSLGFENGISRAYATLIPMHQTTGRLDSAQYYVTQYEALYKKNLSRRTGINYNNSTGLFYKNQGKFAESLPFLLEALRLIGPMSDKTLHAGQMLNIGNAYERMGDLKNAASYHLKSLALFEELGNQRGQSFCLQSLGNDFYKLRQYSVAESYYSRSAKLKDQLGDKRGVISSWQSLGALYQRTKRPEKSLEYSMKALTRAKEFNLVLEQKEILYNIGSLMKDEKKNDEARKFFAESEVLARQNGDSLRLSMIRAEVAMMDSDEKKGKEEESDLINNIKVSLESGDRANTSEGHFKMAEWYAAHGQHDKAFENIKLAYELNDSLRGNEIIVQLKRLEEEYKNEQKEKEIALLKKDQELNALTLGRQRATITAIVIALVGVVVIAILLINRYRVVNKAKRQIEIERVRNTIARDLHDDIGSTLSSINILSQVALFEKNGSTENYLQRIGDQSSRMMEDISDIVWSINPHNDSMKQVIIRMREFSTEILESKNISYHFSEKVTEGLTLNADKRKNLFLIFKESINNAAKYSKASKVEINLYQQDHTLVMAIKDNGQGFDEGTIKSGNGLRNMQERAKEINGSVTLNSVAGNGTAVELRLPLA